MSVLARRVVTISAVVALVMATVVVSALATATSGRSYRGSPGNNYNLCAEAEIVTPNMDNNAWTISQDYNTGCWNDNYSAPSGWLGAYAMGYRDGAYCGTTGFYYNSVSTYRFGVGSVLCSNPSGTQAFKTGADSKGWNPSTLSYVNYTAVQSPNQNG